MQRFSCLAVLLAGTAYGLEFSNTGDTIAVDAAAVEAEYNEQRDSQDALGLVLSQTDKLLVLEESLNEAVKNTNDAATATGIMLAVEALKLRIESHKAGNDTGNSNLDNFISRVTQRSGCSAHGTDAVRDPNNEGEYDDNAQVNACHFMLPMNLNYGCWCHHDSDDEFRGRGAFVDEYDRICKTFKQCFRCVKWDARQNGENCEPGSQQFYTLNQYTTSGILETCVEANIDQGDCAIHTCSCQRQFAKDMWDLFLQISPQVPLVDDYYHANGFDWETNEACRGAGPTPFEKECCGEYPQRRMYSTEDRACCANKKIFNPDVHMCCPDGTTVISSDNCKAAKRRRKRASFL